MQQKSASQTFLYCEILGFLAYVWEQCKQNTISKRQMQDIYVMLKFIFVITFRLRIGQVVDFLEWNQNL